MATAATLRARDAAAADTTGLEDAMATQLRVEPPAPAPARAPSAADRARQTAESEAMFAAHAHKVTTEVRRVQREKLREILSYNAACQYLTGLGVDGDTDVETFKRKVPIVQYEDLEETFARLANGELATDIYSVDPVDFFILSSGTSKGKAKLLPSSLKRFGNYVFQQRLAASIIASRFPGVRQGKSMVLAFIGQQIQTPSGIMAGQGSTNWYKSAYFRRRPYDPDHQPTSPDAVILCEDYKQAMYCHLVCGLAQSAQVSRISAIFGSTILAALRTLQAVWRDICADLRDGTLNPARVTDPAARAAVLAFMGGPNPALAAAVARECGAAAAAGGSWDGIVPRLWPNAAVLLGVFTGTMAQYVPMLRGLAGGVPLVSPGYASAESNVVGLNMAPEREPEDTRFVLWPECVFFELLPVGKDGAAREEETVELGDAVVGREYEPVLTTKLGLYRYRVGDVVQVTGFYNATPEVKFMRRRGVLLSIHQDKTDETDLQSAVTKAAGVLLQHASAGGAAVELVDYSSCTDVSTHPGHYVIYFELAATQQGQQPALTLLLQECATALDRAITNEIYARHRKLGIIGPLELRVVAPGTFERLMLQAVARGSTPQQYKTPRCVQFAPALELLDGAVEHSVFSLAADFVG